MRPKCAHAAMAKLKSVHEIALNSIHYFVHYELKSFNMSLKGLICCRIVKKFYKMIVFGQRLKNSN